MAIPIYTVLCDKYICVIDGTVVRNFMCTTTRQSCVCPIHCEIHVPVDRTIVWDPTSMYQLALMALTPLQHAVGILESSLLICKT